MAVPETTGASNIVWFDIDNEARMYAGNLDVDYAHVVDFIKLHYCLSERTDSEFWRDNRAPASVSDGLQEKLRRWRHRPLFRRDLGALT